MRSPELPDPVEVMPHSGAMVMLSRIEHHAGDTTICRARPADCGLFTDATGELPAWVGIELMAQCVAVHGGLTGRERGEPPRIGLLLGAKRLVFHRARYHADEQLIVTVTRVWGREFGLVSFECSIAAHGSGELLASGRLSCFVPRAGELPEGLVESE